MTGSLPAPDLPADGAVVDGLRTGPAPTAADLAGTTGAVVIPAHDEAAVIGRTLRSLAPLTALPGFEVIVVCNGSTDATAEVARGFDGVRVLELAEASKTAALNAGDAAATRWPRLYLDADIEIAPAAVLALFRVLAEPAVMAARPRSVYDVSGASWPVRAYYRARSRIPAPPLRLWGGGGYAVNEPGHRRFAQFPDVTADDSWFDEQFVDHEKRVVATVPMRVRTPKDTEALVAVLTRQRRGYVELGVESDAGRRVTTLLATVRSPGQLLDAACYVLLSLVSRHRSRTVLRQRGRRAWERDSSSRTNHGDHP